MALAHERDGRCAMSDVRRENEKLKESGKKSLLYPCTTNDLKRLSWVLPDIDNLYCINNIIQKYNLFGSASIGCGCRLLGWLLQKYSGLDVVGIELDSFWWNSKYSPPKFLKNIMFVEKELTKIQAPKYMPCYFAILITVLHSVIRNIDIYKGSLILVIGPMEGYNCTTDPLSFDKKFEQYNWKFIRKNLYVPMIILLHTLNKKNYNVKKIMIT